MIVVDASVLVKLFKQHETDSGIAKSLAEGIARGEVRAAAPDLILYECLSAALHIGVDFLVVRQLFDGLASCGMQLMGPNAEDLALSQRIATTEARSGGYPTLFDSIYHAIAINRGGTFVTADGRHVSKAAGFGHVMLLAEWKA